MIEKDRIDQKFNAVNETPLVVRIKNHLMNLPDEQLYHIDLYRTADDWTIPRKELLEFALRAVKLGIFELQWEFHCVQCGGVARETLTLKETSGNDYCPVCKLDFSNSLDRNIEVFFNISSSLKKLDAVIISGYMEKVMHDVTHGGRYEWQKETTIFGTDCINNPVFRELFGDDAIPLDQSLEIKSSTILFTDIKSSTAMYERLGDAKAFKLVREHFKIIFAEIEKYNGVPVKTIGDAVMGVFTDEYDGLNAAIEAQRSLMVYYSSKPAEERIEVKIGLHSGPTLVVTLNGRLDYFGSTVNRAARIQSLAEPNEVTFSEGIFGNERNRKYISGCTKVLKKKEVSLKGIEDRVVVYRASCVDA